MRGSLFCLIFKMLLGPEEGTIVSELKSTTGQNLKKEHTRSRIGGFGVDKAVPVRNYALIHTN